MAKILEKILSRNVYVYITLFCLTLAVYCVVLRGPFFFDDNIFIQNNTSVQSFNLPKIYTSSTTAGSGISGDNFYRPNEQSIYALLVFIFGLAPFAFHFLQIAIHVTVGFLIFLFFCDLGIRRPYAFLGSLIFLLHPIQTEAVSYISGLSDPFVALTLVGALVLFVRGAKSAQGFGWKRIVAIIALTIIGFFSKENAVILSPLIAIALMYLYKHGKLLHVRAAAWIWAGVTALTLAYLALRFTVLNFTSSLTGGFGIATATNIYTQSLAVRLITFVSILYQYVVMLVAPLGLHYETPYVAYTTLSTASGIFGLIMIILGAYLAYRSLVRGTGVFFVAYAWFFVALLPMSGIIPTNAMYLEHWLYLPIVGLIFLVAHFLQTHHDNHMLTYICIIVLCIYAVLGVSRNLDWADPIRFYENELQYSSTARMYSNLGLELANRGDCADAVPNYEEAIAISDTYPQTHYDLGRCLEDSGDTAGATAEYQKSLQIDPNFSYSIARLQALSNK